MAVKYWEAKAALYEFDYDTGTHAPVIGELINVDVEAEETAYVQAWTVTSGAWGTSDAAGKMWVYSCSATFITNLENDDALEDSGATQICITTGGVTLRTSDWQIPGNWGLGENPSIPVADDEVIFDGRSVIDVTDGIAVGETGGIDFDKLHIKVGYTGNIGLTDERLHTSAEKIFVEGSGTYYIEISEDATGKDQTIELMIVNNKSCTVYLTSNQNDASWICMLSTLLVSAGTIEIGDLYIATFVGTIKIAPQYNRDSNVTVIIHEDCVRTKATAAQTTIQMSGGTCTCDSALEEVIIYGGTFNYGTDLGLLPETGLDIGILYLYDGAVNWYPDDSSNDAYIGAIFLFGGSFLTNASTNGNRSKVLGNGAGYDIYIFEGATMNLANGRGNITIASGSILWSFGGTIILDSGSKLAITYDVI